MKQSPDSMMSRREILGATAAAVFGINCGAKMVLADENNPPEKQLLYLWQEGGQCQRLLNPKPNHQRIQDVFQNPIETSIRGTRICELLPRFAARLRNVVLFRARHTQHFADHLPGMREQMLTRDGVPNINSQRSHFLIQLAAQGNAPITQVAFQESPNVNTGDDYRHSAFAVQNMFELRWNAQDNSFVFSDANMEVDTDDLQRRNDLLQHVDTLRVGGSGQDVLNRSDAIRARANALLMEQGQRPFSVSQCRIERYCPPGDLNPQGIGLATMVELFDRRLISVGFFRDGYDNVYGAWDQHADYQERARRMARRMDYAHSALLQDFEDERLPENLSIATNQEFGRTPRLNSGLGRDHYPWFSSWIASRQLRRGMVIGRTNAEDVGDEGVVNATDYAAIVRELMTARPNRDVRSRYPFFVAS